MMPIDPKTDVGDMLRDQLRKTVEVWRMIGSPPGAWIAEECVARVGIVCTAQALPPRYAAAMPTRCFYNARALVRRSKGRLRYCEGFARRLSLSFAFHHAWALDRDNRVIDPTWNDPADCLYLGIPLDWATLRRWTVWPQVSVLDDGVQRKIDFIFDRCPDLRAVLDEWRAARSS